MRESIIFLKYNFARFSFGRENDFSMMLSIDEVRRVKRYGNICLCKNTEVKFSFFFCLAMFWQKYISIGIAKILGILRVYFSNFMQYK